MVGLPGPRLDPVARELVRDLKVGGVILFARNIESPEQVWELTRDLQREALAATGRPLLIAVDQEGGTVQRLRSPFTLIPPARELGLGSSPEQVRELARQVARELRVVGLNVKLAPVLDVARGPECPLWGRSYGPDPGRVAALGVAAIKGYLDGGVIPMAKHFPGLGDTVIDSHKALALADPANSSRDLDLAPFREAVAQGVPAIMTAHLLVPQWDARPATLSRKVLEERLRRGLGFTGVIITDDLEMGGITSQLPVPQASREAMAAGADLLLICQNYQAPWESAGLLAREPALESRGRESVSRLNGLRQKLSDLKPASLREVRDYFSGGK